MNFLHPRYCENTRDEEDTIFAHNHIGVRAENHSAQLTIAEDKIKCSRTKWLRESILTRREHKDLEHTSTGFSTAELGRKEGRKGISKKKKNTIKKAAMSQVLVFSLQRGSSLAHSKHYINAREINLLPHLQLMFMKRRKVRKAFGISYTQASKTFFKQDRLFKSPHALHEVTFLRNQPDNV